MRFLLKLGVEKILIPFWPFNTVLFFRKVTEPVPLKFFERNGTSKFNFTVRHTNDFPVPVSRASVNMNFLPRLKRIRLEFDNTAYCHYYASCKSDQFRSGK